MIIGLLHPEKKNLDRHVQLSSFSGIFVVWAENKNLLFLRRKVEERHKLLVDLEGGGN